MGYINSAPQFFHGDGDGGLPRKQGHLLEAEHSEDHPLELAAEARAADGAGTPEAQEDASW